MEIRLKKKETSNALPVAIVMDADEKAVRHAIAMFGMTCKTGYTAFVLDKISVNDSPSERCKIEKKTPTELKKMTVATNPIAVIFDTMLDKVEIVVAANGKTI